MHETTPRSLRADREKSATAGPGESIALGFLVPKPGARRIERVSVKPSAYIEHATWLHRKRTRVFVR